MSEEERKAIKYFFNLRASIEESYMLFEEELEEELEELNVKCSKEMIKQISTVLNLINKQDFKINSLEGDIEGLKLSINDRDKLIEKKDKIIDEMAKYIEDELTVDEFCSKENCYADNYEDGHCQKCLNCIKQYFERKSENER